MSKLTITDLHQGEALSNSDMGAIAGGRLPGLIGDIAEGIKAAGEAGLNAGGGVDTGVLLKGLLAGAGTALVFVGGVVLGGA